MGTLKPNASYVYERSDDSGTVYAREMGSTERRVVGYSVQPDDQLWREIVAAAANNPTLRAELDRVVTIYSLLKNDDRPTVMHHPV